MIVTEYDHHIAVY